MRKLVYLAVTLILLWVIFGTPYYSSRIGDHTISTRGGILQIMVWSDYYRYGAMVLRDKRTKTGGYAVTWWLRLEWFKRQ